MFFFYFPTLSTVYFSDVADMFREVCCKCEGGAELQRIHSQYKYVSKPPMRGTSMVLIVALRFSPIVLFLTLLFVEKLVTILM